jgi:hypothetical protein
MIKSGFLPKKNDIDSIWLNWFDNLKQDVGVKNARFLWVRWWNELKPTQANTGTLRSEMSRNGVEIQPDTLQGYIGDTVSGFTGFVKGAFTGVGLVVTISTIAAITFTGLALYNLSKDDDTKAFLKEAGKSYFKMNKK